MKSYHDYNAMMPCHDCLITAYDTDLQFIDGKPANANKNMWLHHTGLMNLNRTDLACTHWPERIGVNGNERSPFDYTLNGTRKAGYYLRQQDEVFLAVDVMNSNVNATKAQLVIEWEYVPGTPEGFDIVFPVWLDVLGKCLNESTGVGAADEVFTAMSKTGWTSPYSGDLILMVPHVHDGSTSQRVYLDGKLVCESKPAYGETAEFVTHAEKKDGHGHEHGGDEHILHISSMSQCVNVAKVEAGKGVFTIASQYDMHEHTAMKDHHGELEPIMGIQFLHLARPRDEALKDIAAMKNGNLQAFQNQVRGLEPPAETP